MSIFGNMGYSYATTFKGNIIVSDRIHVGLYVAKETLGDAGWMIDTPEGEKRVLVTNQRYVDLLRPAN